jgi:hypothetical protein
METDPRENDIPGLSAGWRTALGRPGPVRPDYEPQGPGMLGVTDGPARLIFESSSGRRHHGRLDRWLAILRTEPPAGRAVRAVWMLDARSVRWSGGLPPRELCRGTTGLNSEETPILCFSAIGAPERRSRRGATVPGVFGANGILDAASLRVRTCRVGGRLRLGLRVDTDIWGLSVSMARNLWSAEPARHLTISAAGTPRPLEPDTVTRWL